MAQLVPNKVEKFILTKSQAKFQHLSISVLAISSKIKFNRRERLVNSISKSCETHFDKIRFWVKIGAVFQS